ncbi:MAG: hypothetical protein LBJ71_03940 [Holosporaceae bacterium]|jgi:hypothetical protein|nr:hypothetical protein [Holosporaceae bacterium]
MKKILQLIGVCCFGAALMFNDACGIQATEVVEQGGSSGYATAAVQVNEYDLAPLSLFSRCMNWIKYVWDSIPPESDDSSD